MDWECYEPSNTVGSAKCGKTGSENGWECYGPSETVGRAVQEGWASNGPNEKAGSVTGPMGGLRMIWVSRDGGRTVVKWAR